MSEEGPSMPEEQKAPETTQPRSLLDEMKIYKAAQERLSEYQKISEASLRTDHWLSEDEVDEVADLKREMGSIDNLFWERFGGEENSLYTRYFENIVPEGSKLNLTEEQQDQLSRLRIGLVEVAKSYYSGEASDAEVEAWRDNAQKEIEGLGGKVKIEKDEFLGEFKKAGEAEQESTLASKPPKPVESKHRPPRQDTSRTRMLHRRDKDVNYSNTAFAMRYGRGFTDSYMEAERYGRGKLDKQLPYSKEMAELMKKTNATEVKFVEYVGDHKAGEMGRAEWRYVLKGTNKDPNTVRVMKWDGDKFVEDPGFPQESVKSDYQRPTTKVELSPGQSKEGEMDVEKGVRPTKGLDGTLADVAERLDGGESVFIEVKETWLPTVIGRVLEDPIESPDMQMKIFRTTVPDRFVRDKEERPNEVDITFNANVKRRVGRLGRVFGGKDLFSVERQLNGTLTLLNSTEKPGVILVPKEEVRKGEGEEEGKTVQLLTTNPTKMFGQDMSKLIHSQIGREGFDDKCKDYLRGILGDRVKDIRLEITEKGELRIDFISAKRAAVAVDVAPAPPVQAGTGENGAKAGGEPEAGKPKEIAEKQRPEDRRPISPEEFRTEEFEKEGGVKNYYIYEVASPVEEGEQEVTSCYTYVLTGKNELIQYESSRVGEHIEGKLSKKLRNKEAEKDGKINTTFTQDQAEDLIKKHRQKAAGEGRTVREIVLEKEIVPASEFKPKGFPDGVDFYKFYKFVIPEKDDEPERTRHNIYWFSGGKIYNLVTDASGKPIEIDGRRTKPETVLSLELKSEKDAEGEIARLIKAKREHDRFEVTEASLYRIAPKIVENPDVQVQPEAAPPEPEEAETPEPVSGSGALVEEAKQVEPVVASPGIEPAGGGLNALQAEESSALSEGQEAPEEQAVEEEATSSPEEVEPTVPDEEELMRAETVPVGTRTEKAAPERKGVRGEVVRRIAVKDNKTGETKYYAYYKDQNGIFNRVGTNADGEPLTEGIENTPKSYDRRSEKWIQKKVDKEQREFGRNGTVTIISLEEDGVAEESGSSEPEGVQGVEEVVRTESVFDPDAKEKMDGILETGDKRGRIVDGLKERFRKIFGGRNARTEETLSGTPEKPYLAFFGGKLLYGYVWDESKGLIIRNEMENDGITVKAGSQVKNVASRVTNYRTAIKEIEKDTGHVRNKYMINSVDGYDVETRGGKHKRYTSRKIGATK